MAGSFRRKSSERVVTGVRAIDRKLKKFSTAGGNRIARAGLTAGARAVAKAIKKKIPAKLKSVRKAIGHSVKKSKKGSTTAKAGAAVGKASKAKATKRSTKPGGGGKGITRENIHWWMLGTVERFDRTGQSKGEMPRQSIVKDAFNASAIKKIIFAASKKTFRKESLKLQKKKR